MNIKKVLLNIIRRKDKKHEKALFDTMMRPPFENSMKTMNRYNHHRR